MRAAQHIRSLDRALASAGESVTLRRVVPNASSIDVQVRARVTGYQPEELAGGLNQGDRKVILSAEDLASTDFPAPIRPNDKLIVRGRMLNIGSVDDSTRRIGGKLIAWELRATGS